MCRRMEAMYEETPMGSTLRPLRRPAPLAPAA